MGRRPEISPRVRSELSYKCYKLRSYHYAQDNRSALFLHVASGGGRLDDRSSPLFRCALLNVFNFQPLPHQLFRFLACKDRCALQVGSGVLLNNRRERIHLPESSRALSEEGEREHKGGQGKKKEGADVAGRPAPHGDRVLLKFGNKKEITTWVRCCLLVVRKFEINIETEKERTLLPRRRR